MKKLFTLIAMACMALGANAQTYTVESTTETIDETVFKAIVAAAADNAVEVILPAGKEIKVSLKTDQGNETAMVLPDGLSIKFKGESEDSKTTLSWVKSLDFANTHGYIRFENVILTDGGCQYLFNQSAAATVDEISLTNCEFKDFKRSILRTQGSNEITVKNIIVDNCIGTNVGDGYSVFLLGTATTTVKKIEIKNSTFDTNKRSFVEASQAAIENGITISDCTFYNNAESSRYFIDAKGQATNINLTNIILGKTYVETGAKGIRTAATITVTNCLRTSDCVYSSNDIKELPAGDKTSAEIFTDPANHDFTLLIDDKIGDPRWYKPTSTAIQNVNAAVEGNGKAYNLGGRVATKGLLIQNGKKVIK